MTFEQTLSYVRAALVRKPGLCPGGRIPHIERSRTTVIPDERQLETLRQLTAYPNDGYLPLPYPFILSFATHLENMLDPRFPLALMGTVHLRSQLVQHRPIGAGERVRLICSTGPQTETAKGVEFPLETRLYVGSELCWEGTATMLRRRDEELSSDHDKAQGRDQSGRQGGRTDRSNALGYMDSAKAMGHTDRSSALGYADSAEAMGHTGRAGALGYADSAEAMGHTGRAAALGYAESASAPASGQQPPRAPLDGPHAVNQFWQVPARAAPSFAFASGDLNPIHLSSLSAKIFGFSGVIMHGAWMLMRMAGTHPSWCHSAEVAMRCDFKKPLILPSSVVYRYWPRRDGGYELRLLGAQGTVPHAVGQIGLALPLPGSLP